MAPRSRDDGLTIELITEGWEVFVRQLLKGMPKEVEEVAIRKVAIDFLAAVIKKTPKDTARAQAGWQSYLIDHGLPSPVSGDPEAIIQGTAEGTWDERFTSRESWIEIINAVEYIIYLEYGSSGQAPAGMMRLTFREFQAGDKLTKELQERFRKEIIKADKKAKEAARAALRKREAKGG